jgi:tetrahydromethanopterin S-methyltransferase subunit G
VVEFEALVPEQETRAVSERVELRERRVEFAVGEMERRLRRVAANCGKTVNPGILQPDLEVDRQATGSEVTHG